MVGAAMALTLSAPTGWTNFTKDAATVVLGTVSGGTGGTATATLFANTGTSNAGTLYIAVKVIRAVFATATAGDFATLQLVDTAGNSVPIWTTRATGSNFVDQTNFGDDFRIPVGSSLRLNAQITTSTNGTALVFALYHQVD
jgi:hypothetical protein